MKRISLFFFAMMIAGMVFGQERVAVYVTGEIDASINKVLGDQLVAAFTKSGKYIAIERTNSFLAELRKEINYQQTGAVDERQLSALGKQFGVELVCVAEVSEVFGQKYVSVRLIDVERTAVVRTANATSSLEDMNELMRVSENITNDLTGKSASEKAAEAALAETMYILGNLAVSKGITGFVSWEIANKMAKDASLGGYDDWRLPTIGELSIIYGNRNIIWERNAKGNSTHPFPVWSKDQCGKKKYMIIEWSGSNKCHSKNSRVILVRDMK